MLGLGIEICPFCGEKKFCLIKVEESYFNSKFLFQVVRYKCLDCEKQAIRIEKFEMCSYNEWKEVN